MLNGVNPMAITFIKINTFIQVKAKAQCQHLSSYPQKEPPQFLFRPTNIIKLEVTSSRHPVSAHLAASDIVPAVYPSELDPDRMTDNRSYFMPVSLARRRAAGGVVINKYYTDGRLENCQTGRPRRAAHPRNRPSHIISSSLRRAK